MNHKTFKVIFVIIFALALISIILNYVVIAYGATHPTEIGEFFGKIVNGFNSAK